MDLAFIPFQKIKDAKGLISVIEVGIHIPFTPMRTVIISGIPRGEFRGAHANRVQQQVFVATSGKFDLHLRVPGNEKVVSMSGHEVGVFVGPLVWREVRNMSKDASCLLISSMRYGDRSDYIDDWEEFANLWRRIRE